MREGEEIDDLQRDGLSIIQKKSRFSFGIDSVLIANFSEVKRGERVLDVGTGTGIIPILLSAKTEAVHIVGVEIQEEMAEMAQRSVKMNGLEERIKIVHADIRSFAEEHRGDFDVLVSNPPYFKAGGAMMSGNSSKMISRHEISLDIFSLFESARLLLKPRGRFYLIHRPDRMVDIFHAARLSKVEIKQAKMVYSRQNQAPKLLIMECIRDAGSELRWQKPLYIYGEDGDYSGEIYAIYQSSKITSFGEE